MFNSTQLLDGIFYLKEVDVSFEEQYIAVRQKEGRVYSSEQVKALPNHVDPLKEWKLRQQTADLFVADLKKKNSNNLLEIGCGNGWFCNYISVSTSVAQVFGLDINLSELKQAQQVFIKNKKLTWLYASVFSEEIPKNTFDCIVLNGSIQYFSDFKLLLNRLMELLTTNGEIHILDSPFYHSKKEQQQAHKKTKAYYASLGYEEMANNFTPHLWADLQGYNYKIMYKPSLVFSLLRKVQLHSFIKAQNPFCWIKILP